MYGHCITRGENDQNVLYITGGVVLNSGHSRTFFAYTVDMEIFEEMPLMLERRAFHGCHLYEMGDSQNIIVAGGITTGWKRTVSAELYDSNQPGQGWNSVKPLEGSSEAVWNFFSFNAMRFLAVLITSQKLMLYDPENDQWLQEEFPNCTNPNTPWNDIILLNLDKVKACTPK